MNRQLSKSSLSNQLSTFPKSTNSQTDFQTLKGQNEFNCKSAINHGSQETFGARQISQPIDQYFTKQSSYSPRCPLIKLQKDSYPNSKIDDIDENNILPEDGLIELSEFNPPADLIIQQRQLLSAFFIAEILPQESKKLLLLEYDKVIVKLFNVEQPNSYEISITEKNKKTRKIWVKIRKGLERFLHLLSEVYTICVFTTHSHKLSSKILNLIDSGQDYIKALISRDSCKKLNGQLVKDLRIIKNYRMRDIVSVDIQTERINIQQENTYIVKAWQGDEQDPTLEESAIFLYQIAKYPDLRLPIKLKFAPSSKVQVWD